jgi:hypothetical protein
MSISVAEIRAVYSIPLLVVCCGYVDISLADNLVPQAQLHMQTSYSQSHDKGERCDEEGRVWTKCLLVQEVLVRYVSQIILQDIEGGQFWFR